MCLPAMLAAAVAIVFALPACGSCGSSAATIDAGLDGVGVDAAVDAGADAPADAAPDASDDCADLATYTDCVGTATIPVIGSVGRFDMVGTTLYATAHKPTRETVFEIHDLSDPTAPARLGGLDLADTDAVVTDSVEVAPGGELAYLYGNTVPGLTLVDIRDPAHPVVMGGVLEPTIGAGDLARCREMMYVTAIDRGVVALDISNPAAPVHRADGAIAGEPYPFGVSCRAHDATRDHVYVGDGGRTAQLAGLHVFEYDRTTRAFTRRGHHTPSTTSWGHASWPLSGGLLYMLWSSGTRLALFDVSDPDAIPEPTLISNIGRGGTRLFVHGKYLFATAGFGSSDDGLGVFDISTPSAPVVVVQKHMESSIAGVRRFCAGGAPHLAYKPRLRDEIRICRLVGP